MSNPVSTVLFDLDGTLLDTAPDLAAALNATLQLNGREALPFENIRPVVSHGGRALIELGFGLDPQHADFEPLRKQLLDLYEANIAVHTALFPGMADVLEELEKRGIRWGIVTNKPGWLTNPLLDALSLSQRAACVVSGDSLKERKPHPAPLLHACKLADSLPEETLYVGDAERDIEAGRNAGMRTLIALFGYLMEHDQPNDWGADALVEHPAEILQYVNK
ncbi:Similar to phosphoglycolate phosphatase, clustered with ubiquinone biosynthesis SAM-dependent O-methyltransferase [hydrothermal vent metagenome]|uniref:phosphoglycolate phosphatase n=1 Tax=hydrothermal vent metagenome TaxID=652676 RepID=A0A3B0YS82_9ZZZZ